MALALARLALARWLAALPQRHVALPHWLPILLPHRLGLDLHHVHLVLAGPIGYVGTLGLGWWFSPPWEFRKILRTQSTQPTRVGWRFSPLALRR